ncbi:hypothetical protein ACHAXT_003720, partial [Thalassiosira profunda]
IRYDSNADGFETHRRRRGGWVGQEVVGGVSRGDVRPVRRWRVSAGRASSATTKIVALDSDADCAEVARRGLRPQRQQPVPSTRR